MCLLIFKPAGKRIPVNHLLNAADSNPHGAGIAYAKNGALHVLKSPKWRGEEIAEELFSAADYPAIVHFRLATHGRKNNANTHPFLASPSVAFAHNGVLMGYGDAKRDISDTRDFMERHISPPLEKGISLNSRAFRRRVKKWEKTIGHNKFVLLSAKGDHVIVRESLGLWREGVWYSNDSFLPYTSRFISKAKYKGGFGLAQPWLSDREEMEEIEGSGEIGCDVCLNQKPSRFHYLSALYMCRDCEKQYSDLYA